MLFLLEKEMVEVLNKRTDGMSIATGFKPITAKFNSITRPHFKKRPANVKKRLKQNYD